MHRGFNSGQALRGRDDLRLEHLTFFKSLQEEQPTLCTIR